MEVNEESTRPKGNQNRKLSGIPVRYVNRTINETRRLRKMSGLSARQWKKAKKELKRKNKEIQDEKARAARDARPADGVQLGESGNSDVR